MWRLQRTTQTARHRWWLTLSLSVFCVGVVGLPAEARVSLAGLQAEIAELRATVCGPDVTQAECDSAIESSVLQRLAELDDQSVVLEEAVCELAEATGVSLTSIECPETDGGLRIVGGADETSGRLEMNFGGVWGTICDDRWDIVDATVACRQLGYSGADAALYTFNVPDGTGQIWLDDVQCDGTEDRLIDCVHREPVGSHNCSHFEDAGVDCTP